MLPISQSCQTAASRIISNAVLMGMMSVTTAKASLLFDNISAYESSESGAAVTTTSGTPNTFMGDGYVLPSGTTDITGLDLFPVNLTGTKYTGLELAVYVWGTVNTGVVNASTPAFSNLLGSYSLTVAGNYSSGSYYPFEGATRGLSPGFTFATPVQLNGATTIGLTFLYEGTTNGSTYHIANNLMSLISYGVPATSGSDVFNGFYRNVNSETNGNFTSTLKSFNGLVDQTLAVRIFGDVGNITSQWTADSGGSWTVATNWSTSAIPTSTSDVAFNLSSSNYTVTVPSACLAKDLYVQSDSVTLDLPSSASSLTVTGALNVGQPSLGGSNVNGVLNLTRSSGGASANVSAASLTVGGNGSSGRLNIGSAVNLAIAGIVSVGNGSNLAIASGGKLIAATVSIAGSTDAWTGLLDIGTSALDLPSANLAIITNQILQGYNPSAGGRWNGIGGITSINASNDPTHLSSVGAILNNDGTGAALYGSGTTLGTFGGSSPGLNDILVRFTYVGDVNLDGKVDGSDYSRIDSAYLADISNSTAMTGWYNGDFNYDGVINGSDYTLIDNAFNTQGALITSVIGPVVGATSQIAGTSSVPEPSAAAIILVIGSITCRRRRSVGLLLS
jgi:hypothetical protein